MPILRKNNLFYWERSTVRGITDGVIPLAILFIVLSPLFGLKAQDGENAEEKKENRIVEIGKLVDRFYNEESGQEPNKFDTNNDGRVDYLVRTTKEGAKTAEVLDYDHNGKMDDFYYYKAGKLERRELDSNADGKIDIWVYIENGVYVKKYERDVDYDGTVDSVKDYEEEYKKRKKQRLQNSR